MRALIIPDIHNRVDFIEKFVSENEANYNRVIFLGDYFDSFNDTPEKAKKTALWLRESTTKANRVHLIGNHDLSYMFPKKSNLWCPGFKESKCEVINKVLLESQTWKSLQISVWEQGYLLSHAGIDVRHLPYRPNLTLEESINTLVNSIIPCISKNNYHPLLNLGSRMGEIDVGGIFWQDWGDLQIVPGLQQIVGHTCHAFPRVKYHHKDGKVKKLEVSKLSKKSFPKEKNIVSANYCLDVVGNSCAGVIEDGKFTFLNVKTNEKLDLEVLEYNCVNENLSNNGWGVK